MYNKNGRCYNGLGERIWNPEAYQAEVERNQQQEHYNESNKDDYQEPPETAGSVATYYGGNLDEIAGDLGMDPGCVDIDDVMEYFGD